MKRCPTCHRVETDEALKFCRIDGTTLVNDSSAIPSEAGTVQLASPADTSEVHTSVLPPRTDININRATAPTTVLPPTQPTIATRQLAKNGSKRVVIAIAALILVILVIVGGY